MSYFRFFFIYIFVCVYERRKYTIDFVLPFFSFQKIEIVLNYIYFMTNNEPKIRFNTMITNQNIMSLSVSSFHSVNITFKTFLPSLDKNIVFFIVDVHKIL